MRHIDGDGLARGEASSFAAVTALGPEREPLLRIAADKSLYAQGAYSWGHLVAEFSNGVAEPATGPSAQRSTSHCQHVEPPVANSGTAS